MVDAEPSNNARAQHLNHPTGETKLSGIVQRVTYHNAETGWAVVKVAPFDTPGRLATVVVHQVEVFAGATADFFGTWVVHPRYGTQFKAQRVVERQPATLAALEKYLGSGLIAGVGPKTAQKIVRHFGAATLEVLEHRLDDLLAVRGIAASKLEAIAAAWKSHQAIRQVMLFLQQYGVSTLFAVKIYKFYGDAAIAAVQSNPYRLAQDIYGVGFFSADRIALAMGFSPDGEARLEAGVRHVLAASRDQGHCFLTRAQIVDQTSALLASAAGDAPAIEASRLEAALHRLTQSQQVRLRLLSAAQLGWAPDAPAVGDQAAAEVACYYDTALFCDEALVAKLLRRRLRSSPGVDAARVLAWMERYSAAQGLHLSAQQHAAIVGMVQQPLAILTGGPGCGKTTATRVLVRLLLSMGRRVMLAAPTGRAAQRMQEVIGLPARTVHRLLEWDPRRLGFKRCAALPLETDCLIVDEASMLDISLAAALLPAVPRAAQLLLIGDPSQLPAVGAGNVLRDLLHCPQVPRFTLTQVFRQAQSSHIVRYAHLINQGETPHIASPLAQPNIWTQPVDCLFVDAEEATVEQLRFIRRAKAAMAQLKLDAACQAGAEEPAEIAPAVLTEFSIPRKFLHVDLAKLAATQDKAAELAAVLRRLPAHSALHYGMSAADVVRRLVTQSVPKHLGTGCEVQVLTPMNRGSLGAQALNSMLQEALNPGRSASAQLQVGERVLRVGDRVMQRRNNYDKGVFNGDIGRIVAVDASLLTCEVSFASAGAPVGPGVVYEKDDLMELTLAYAITIHKSQGSEFPVVVIPLAAQHYTMLFRNLIYTGLTRAKKMAIFVGSRAALRMAVQNVDSHHRQTALTCLLNA